MMMMSSELGRGAPKGDAKVEHQKEIEYLKKVNQDLYRYFLDEIFKKSSQQKPEPQIKKVHWSSS